MNGRRLFQTSAVLEILTGLAFLVAPALIVGLLLGDGINLIGIGVARVLGVGLLSIGIAAWETRGQDTRLASRAGLCIYNVGAAALLAMLGTTGGMDGLFLWPVAILHGLIGLAMLWILSEYVRYTNKN